MIYLLNADVSGQVKIRPTDFSARDDKDTPDPGGALFDWRFGDPLPEELVHDFGSRTIIYGAPLKELIEVPLAIMSGYIIANETFKSILEGLEPGVHSFIELPLWSAKDKAYSEIPYYLVNVTAKVRCVDMERSRTMVGTFEGRDYGILDGLLPTNWVVDETHCEGHHLWRDDICTMSFFGSQELRDRLRAEKIRGIIAQKTTLVYK